MEECGSRLPPQDTAAALGMWLEDRRARDTSTVARFWGPRFAGEALPGLKPWQGSPPLLTIIAPPPPAAFFSMARPHTWFTRLLICSCWTQIRKRRVRNSAASVSPSWPREEVAAAAAHLVVSVHHLETPARLVLLHVSQRALQTVDHVVSLLNHLQKKHQSQKWHLARVAPPPGV